MTSVMLEYDFEQSVAYWVVMTAHAFERALNNELSQHGITYRQWQVLGWLALEGELSQVELAERMRIEPPTLVGILERMERAEWIRRRPCPMDRRRRLVSPAPSAEPIWSKVVACARKIRGQATLGIDEADLHKMKATLGKIRDNLGAREVQPTGRDACDVQGATSQA
jgi:MarR family transcriptional regulator for hemolysin